LVKFLIYRPIAVLVSSLAMLIMGIIAAGLLPVSLMPDIDIPEVTVQISYPNTSARELENVVVKPLRNQLITLNRLSDIESETRDGSSVIRLKFNYGTRTDYAFLEVNEKIDRSMVSLPRDIKRPQVIKASATDIPVFYLNLTLKNPVEDGYSEARFLQVSEFAGEVIRKRIEQLPQVAMVDMTGRSFPEMQILPDQQKLQAMNLTLDQIEQALKVNNISIGNLLVREGQYQYHIRFASYLRTPEDVANIYLKVADRVIQLREIATVRIRPQDREGLYLSGQSPAIGLAIIKQADARMEELRMEMADLLAQFEQDYPDIQFEISQDQTQLLNVSISSLRQSLLIGGILAFLVMFFFLQDGRAPWLIGLTIPAALIVSLLIFYLIGLSINIISLSGLILGVGLMIDNSIIVIDNISQHLERGRPLDEACILGTNEVIRPLISSALTTSAVFVPLIFLSGISGALFYDQAMAITIGLGTSLLVSITLLPTTYRLFYRKSQPHKLSRNAQKRRLSNLTDRYERGIVRMFRYKWLALAGFLLLPALSAVLFQRLPLERLPQVEQKELLLTLDWNEPLNVDENRRRIYELLTALETTVLQSNSQIGQQQFALESRLQQQMDEATLYINLESEEARAHLEEELTSWLADHYPSASYSFDSPPNIFDRLFGDDQATLIARISQQQTRQNPPIAEINTWVAAVNQDMNIQISPVPSRKYIAVRLRTDRLVLYEVDHQVLYNTLKSAFQAYEVDVLRSQQRMIPVVLRDQPRILEEIIQETTVRNAQDQLVPVSALVSLVPQADYASLYAGKGGEYVPIDFDIDPRNASDFLQGLRDHIRQTGSLDVTFAGSIFENQQLLRELLWVLGISLLLLYFILAAQFESLLQPIIVLLEVPMDISGALVILWLFGSSVNLLSMIGMIVMSGIIINDSILKIDTINQLRNAGMPLEDAIREGGSRRLKPIIMTSLTTILAARPFLFPEGLGADLQKPLALALIGGMTLGTVVSLYFIPLAYRLIIRKS